MSDEVFISFVCGGILFVLLFAAYIHDKLLTPKKMFDNVDKDLIKITMKPEHTLLWKTTYKIDETVTLIYDRFVMYFDRIDRSDVLVIGYILDNFNVEILGTIDEHHLTRNMGEFYMKCKNGVAIEEMIRSTKPDVRYNLRSALHRVSSLGAAQLNTSMRYIYAHYGYLDGKLYTEKNKQLPDEYLDKKLKYYGE